MPSAETMHHAYRCILDHDHGRGLASLTNAQQARSMIRLLVDLQNRDYHERKQAA